MSKPEPAEDFTIAQQHAPNTRGGLRSAGWIALIVLVGGLSFGAGHHISTDSIAEAATDFTALDGSERANGDGASIEGRHRARFAGQHRIFRDVDNSRARLGLHFATFRRHRDAGEKGRCAGDHPFARA